MDENKNTWKIKDRLAAANSIDHGEHTIDKPGIIVSNKKTR